MVHNIDVYFEASHDGYRVRVDSPMGQAASEFDLPFSEVEIENFILKMGMTRSGKRRVDSPQMALARYFGQEMFNAVFTEATYARLRSTLDQAHIAGEETHIQLHLQSVPELAALPWEYLYDEGTDSFLALSSATPVTRYLQLPQPVRPLKTTRPLRILGIVSSPKNLAELDVTAEQQHLEEAIAGLVQRGLVNALEVHWLAQSTLSALQGELRRNQYHILHFVGHGLYDAAADEGALVFEDKDGLGYNVSASVLGALLRDHKTLRMAVLNACEGARTGIDDPFAGVAPALVRSGLPAVAAMQFEITDLAAILFAREFYGALADGYGVNAALVEARKAIFASGNDVEWATPVLVTRVESGVIFQLPQREEIARETLDQQYRQILHLVRDDQWQAAWAAWNALHQLAPDYVDRANVTELIQNQLATVSLYNQMSELVVTRQWQKALTIWQEILELDSTYSDPERLAVRAQQGLEVERAATMRAARLERLYAEVGGLISLGQWEAARTRWSDIRAVDPMYVDKYGYDAQISVALAHAPAEHAAGPASPPDKSAEDRSKTVGAVAASAAGMTASETESNARPLARSETRTPPIDSPAGMTPATTKQTTRASGMRPVRAGMALIVLAAIFVVVAGWVLRDRIMPATPADPLLAVTADVASDEGEQGARATDADGPGDGEASASGNGDDGGDLVIAADMTDTPTPTATLANDATALAASAATEEASISGERDTEATAENSDLDDAAALTADGSERASADNEAANEDSTNLEASAAIALADRPTDSDESEDEVTTEGGDGDDEAADATDSARAAITTTVASEDAPIPAVSSPTETPTNTPRPPATPTSTDTPAPPTATNTPTRTPTKTVTNTPRPTATSTATATPVPPTATNTPRPTATPTATASPVPPTATNTPTRTPTKTATNTPRPTATPTATNAPTTAPTTAPVSAVTEPPPTAPAPIDEEAISADELSGRLAFTYRPSHADHIETALYDFAQQRVVLYLPNARQPDYSPDGRLLVNGEGGGTESIIYTDSNLPVTDHVEDGYPQWAPNGNSMVYASTANGGRRSQLYVQSDARKQIGSEPMRVAGAELRGQYPVYLDNWRIAYSGCDQWAGGSNCGIYSADTNGGTPNRVTARTDDIPTGNLGAQVLFMSRREGSWDVYTVNWDGVALQRLTEAPSRDGLATASPDGQYIAFISDRDGGWGMFVMRSDGTGVTKLFDLGQNFGSGDQDWTRERTSWGP